MGSSETNSESYERDVSLVQDDFGSMVKPDMWWAKCGPMDMEYIRGTPWCLYFKRIGRAEKSVNLRLHCQSMRKRLILIEEDEIFLGRLVCAKNDGIWFRGFITKDLSDKVEVFDMDRGDFKEIDRSRLYEWAQVIRSIPPQIVLCSLVPDDSFPPNLWCNDLQTQFMITMMDCTFKVELVSCLDQEDPICGDGFEGLRFYVTVKGMSNFYTEVVDFNIWLLERLLPEVRKNPSNGRYGEAYLNSLKHLNPFDELQAASEYNLPRSAQKEEEDYVQRGELAYPEENPCNAYIELPQPEDEDDCMVDFSNMYKPKEHNYCHLKNKMGYCPKLLCEKLHPPVSSRWTEDQIETEMDLFNYANLPSSGATIKVKVLSVVSSRTIYVDLMDNKYSDIGEMSGTFETFFHLDSSLNDIKNCIKYSCLKVVPCIGELVIVFDPEDQRFKRGRVITVSEYLCSVFLIDFGYEIVVKLKKLMHIPQKYLHLPQQAILTHLVGLKDQIHNENPEKTKKYLQTFVGKFLFARVLDSDVLEGFLTVRLTAQA